MERQDASYLSIVDQVTHLLNAESVKSAAAFKLYQQHYQLDLIDISLAAGVRYLTVWNIAHGIAVRDAHASFLRLGLWKLTGVPYQAAIYVLPDSVPLVQRVRRQPDEVRQKRF